MSVLRWNAWGVVLSIVLYLVWAEPAATHGHPTAAAIVTALLFVGLMTSWRGALGGLIAAFYLGSGWLIGAFTLLVTCRLLARVIPVWALQPRTDPARLTAAVDAVDPRLAQTLTRIAGDGPISTVVMGQALAAEDPEFWNVGLGPDAQVSWDGYLIRDEAGRAWTSIAAEAVILAAALARHADESTECRRLAVAGLILPESALSMLIDRREALGEIVPTATGLGREHIEEIVAAFVTGPTGSDAFRRINVRKLDPEETASTEALFHLSNRRLGLAHVTMTAIEKVAILLVIGMVVVTPFRALWRLLRWERRDKKAPPAETVAQQSTATRRQRQAGLRTLSRRFTAWLSTTARLTSWQAAITVRIVRPTATTAAIVLTAASPGLPWWSRALLAAFLLLARPLRRWWLDVPVALLALYAGLPLVASAIAVRAIVTGVIVQRWGIGPAVVEPRRAILVSAGESTDLLVDPAAIWSRRLTDDEALIDVSLEYLGAEWANADGFATVAALVKVSFLEALGIAVFAADRRQLKQRPRFFRRLQPLLVVDGAIRSLTFFLVIVIGVCVALLTAPRGAVAIAGWHLPGRWLAAGLAALFAWYAARPQPATKRAVVTAAAALWWLKAAALPSIAAVVAGAALARSVRQRLNRRALNAAPPMSWAPLRVTGVRNRRRFRAAAMLAADGRPGIALDVLDELIDRAAGHRPALETAVLAQSSLIELERGRLQKAVDFATRSAEASLRSPSKTAAALSHYALGIVHFSLGAYDRAAEELGAAEPVLIGRPEGATCVSVLTRSYAALHESVAAGALARRAGGQLTGPGRLLALVESEVAAGWAMLHANRPADAKAFVQDLLQFVPDVNSLRQFDPTNGSRDSWLRTIGHAHLLLGRVNLVEADIEAAEEALRNAAQHFRRTVAPDLLGITKIYQGHCLRLREQWAESRTSVSAGIDMLEVRRGQLNAGVNRAAVVSSGSHHYDTAFSVLVDAQAHGDAQAGTVAAELVESLRRSALAAMMRHDRESDHRFSEPAREAMGRIAEIELAVDSAGRVRLPTTDEAELAELRDKLKDHVSEGFAASYLPEEVDHAQLRAVAVGAHILQFELIESGAERWRGYRVWAPPDGTPRVDEVTVADPEALAVLNGVRSGAMVEALFSTMDFVTGSWAALACALLPGAMIQDLRRRSPMEPLRLLIVPGEHLAYLPWAALALDAEDEDALLLHKAVIQVVPSLGLLRPRAGMHPGVRLLAYLDDEAVDQIAPNGPVYESWQRLTTSLPVVLVRSRSEFEHQLSDPRYSGVYVVAHGSGSGLGQVIQFSHGGVLSAANALRFRWPRSLVFGSCFAAQMEQRSGLEPFGLVIACLLGGCRTAIGGVVAVERAATGAIAADASIAIAASADPAAALRAAQRTYLDEYGSSAFVNKWAGLICISTEWTT